MSEQHGWNHVQCGRCWLNKWGLTRRPVRVKDDDLVPCCFCGTPTDLGIYVRMDQGDSSLEYCPARTVWWRS